jgi:hypothetical protein
MISLLSGDAGGSLAGGSVKPSGDDPFDFKAGVGNNCITIK